MQLKEILDHFNIDVELPDYLYSESFNEIFCAGEVEIDDGSYKISIKTRQNVTHNMIIKPDDETPITIISKLPSGLLNGVKFGQVKGDVTYTDHY
jgi:hypothetical protein